MTDILKLLSTFLMCSIFFGKVGVPASILYFEYNFVKFFFFSMTAAITGNIAFTYLSERIIKAIHAYRVRRHTIHTKRIFTRTTRRIIRVKNKFGLGGIAFIAPMFLSIPLGTFVAERFFRNKKKIILYFTVSEIFWALLLYFLFDKVKSWWI
jgi:hypothetical protein